MGSSKSAKIILSKSIFDVKNQLNFFKKSFHFKNINLGDHLLVKTFVGSIFEPNYFLKLCPIFDGIIGILKKSLGVC